MKGKLLFIIFYFFTITFSGCNESKFNPITFNTYSPTIIKDDKHLFIQIPVEIDKKNNKNPFSIILQKYGFSGNGPSIEQIIKFNISFKNAIYNSEGDCFRVEFKSLNELNEYFSLLKPIQDEEILHKWTFNAKNIILKE